VKVADWNMPGLVTQLGEDILGIAVCVSDWTDVQVASSYKPSRYDPEPLSSITH